MPEHADHGREDDPRTPTGPTAPASTPEEEVRPGPGPSRAGRLLGAAVAIGVLLLGWFLFVYAEPVPEGPGVDEIEQEEDDAIDSTDG